VKIKGSVTTTKSWFIIVDNVEIVFKSESKESTGQLISEMTLKKYEFGK
jgi:hypothetical protein